MLAGFDTKEAWALCTFAYSAGPGTEPVLFEGRTDGLIVPARGTAGFGWDAIFEVEDTGKTYGPSVFFPLMRVFTHTLSYAEMAPELKNRLSQRYRALAKLKEYLATLNQQPSG